MKKEKQESLKSNKERAPPTIKTEKIAPCLSLETSKTKGKI